MSDTLRLLVEGIAAILDAGQVAEVSDFLVRSLDAQDCAALDAWLGEQTLACWRDEKNRRVCLRRTTMGEQLDALLHDGERTFAEQIEAACKGPG